MLVFFIVLCTGKLLYIVYNIQYELRFFLDFRSQNLLMLVPVAKSEISQIICLIVVHITVSGRCSTEYCRGGLKRTRQRTSLQNMAFMCNCKKIHCTKSFLLSSTHLQHKFQHNNKLAHSKACQSFQIQMPFWDRFQDTTAKTDL